MLSLSEPTETQQINIADMREKPVNWLCKGIYFSSGNNFANLGFFAIVSATVQSSIPCLIKEL